MTDEPCDRASPHLGELALGVLGGRERADVVAHLAHCRQCADDEQRLSAVGDALIDLVPASEPPLGFENRVLSRLGGAAVTDGGSRVPRPSRRRPRWHSRLALAAACSAAIFVAGFAARQATDSTTRPTAAPHASSQPVQRSQLLAAGRRVGDIVVDRSAHPWVYVEVRGVSPTIRYVRCVLTYRDGRTEDLGSYPLSSGSAGWGARVSGHLDQLAGARLIGPDGSTIATAAL